MPTRRPAGRQTIDMCATTTTSSTGRRSGGSEGKQAPGTEPAPGRMCAWPLGLPGRTRSAGDVRQGRTEADLTSSSRPASCRRGQASSPAGRRHRRRSRHPTVRRDVASSPVGALPGVGGTQRRPRSALGNSQCQPAASGRRKRGVLTMAIQRVHAREVLLAALAWVRADVQMQLFVPLTVVLPREALAASGPLALIRLLFRMRA